MEKKEAIERMLEVMKISEAAYLTTIDKDRYPQTRAMLNLRNDQQFPGLKKVFENHMSDLLIYFTTNASSSKILQIQNNPKVSVYFCRPSEWKGLMLGGMIEVVEEQEIKQLLWQENWSMYYSKGPTDPDYAILRLQPSVAKLYYQMDSFSFEVK